MVIATRILKLASSAGVLNVPVEIMQPEYNGGGWLCRYTIGWPDKAWTSATGGSDSLQALLCAMQKIGMELYFSKAHRSGKLSWSSDWKGYGFPVPHNARDMLVGEDSKFL